MGRAKGHDMRKGKTGVPRPGHERPLSCSDITADTPLRLKLAAALAYPDGSMSASGLRREAKRGRLEIERTAGKDYTTLANIERMRELCRVEAKVPASGSVPHGVTRRQSYPTADLAHPRWREAHRHRMR